MKHSFKRWSILIYALVLVTISLTMATIILSSSTTLSLNHDYINIKNKLSRVISDNARVVFKLARSLNSNWGGFTDNISCPWDILGVPAVSMSGSTNSGTIETELYADDSSIYCSWTYLNQPLKIYFNSGSTDFPLAEYDWSLVTLTNSWSWKIWSLPFWDSDSTLIDFSWYDYSSTDGLDDNANSDNFSVNSTGWQLYNNGFQDDDALHRKIKFGYVTPWTGFNSIFWNNTKTSNYIDNNIYNGDSLNEKIWKTSSWSLYLTIDQRSNMYIYQFDKDKYNKFNELKYSNRFESTIDAWEWYIQNNLWVISLSSDETWRNDYNFDFINYDYAILLENTTSEVLSYNIKWYDNATNKDLYIVPVDDSDDILLKYLGNSIVIDEEKRLISEQKEVVSSK